MFKKIIVLTAMLGTLGAYAHEGHDNAPGALKANHGGVVKAGKEINLEYVVKGDLVELYPVSHEGKDLTSVDVKLTVKTTLPKSKPEVTKVDVKNGVFVAKADFKGAYRIEFNVVADNKGKQSNFKFQVEK